MSSHYIDALTEEYVLYIIDPKLLEEFKQIASQYKNEISPYIPVAFQDLNIYVTILNIWIPLHLNEKDHFLDESKRMHYASAFFQLEYIANNSSIKNFIAIHRLNKDQLFFLTFFISIQCMSWLMKIMEEAEQQSAVHYYMEEENFVNYEKDTASEKFQQELHYQKHYMHAMLKNIKNTSDFPNAIKFALTQTRDWLQTKASREPI